MHVVVMGCGRVGSAIARRLEQIGHSVAVIDQDPEAFRRLEMDAAAVERLAQWQADLMIVVAYGLLWLLYAARMFRHSARFFGDMVDHLRGPGFFTTVAATAILGSQYIVLAGNMRMGLVLGAIALVFEFYLISVFVARGMAGVFGRLEPLALPVRGPVPGVAIAACACRLVDHEARDPHRVDPDHHWRLDLDRELDAHLVALPEVLELRGLALGQADVGRRPIARDHAHGLRIEAESTTDVGDGEVWT